MILSNKVYDAGRWLAQYALPGAATLYFALSGIWGLPYTEEIVGSIVAVDVFVGAVLGLSNIQYKKEQVKEGYMSATYMSVGGCGDRSTSNWSLNPDTYEIIKWVVMIVFPATGALYFALSQLWGFPYGEQVVGTVAAVTAFMGLLLGVSTNKHLKG